MALKRTDQHRLIFTSDQGSMCPACRRPTDHCVCKKDKGPRGDGKVRIALDKKGRRGKSVTLITGLALGDAELKSLAKELKKRCGGGGAVKNGAVEIQGDHRQAVAEFLEGKGISARVL